MITFMFAANNGYLTIPKKLFHMQPYNLLLMEDFIGDITFSWISYMFAKK